jgi:hypothetical protein
VLTLHAIFGFSFYIFSFGRLCDLLNYTLYFANLTPAFLILQRSILSKFNDVVMMGPESVAYMLTAVLKDFPA